MFRDTWKKYLPVIAILIKRSSKAEQTLNLDESDFKRAAGGKKIRFSFDEFLLENGRIQRTDALSPMARGFAEALASSDLIKLLVGNQDIAFGLNNSFQLSIKNITQPAAVTPGDAAE